MEDRAILGKETVKLKNGEVKEINVYDVGFWEKSQLVKRYTEVKLEKGYQYKIVDEVTIMEEIMKIALQDIPKEQWGYNTDKLIYTKYFSPDSVEKKDETSIPGQTATE